MNSRLPIKHQRIVIKTVPWFLVLLVLGLVWRGHELAGLVMVFVLVGYCHLFEHPPRSWVRTKKPESKEADVIPIDRKKAG